METSSTILVHNKEARVHNIGIAAHKPLADGKVLQMEHQDIVLGPGWNPVDSKLWEKAKLNPIVMMHIKSGALEERSLSPEEIKSLTEAEAMRFIQETWDDGLLKRMRAAESRGDVLATINAQIAALEPSPEAKAKAEAAKARK